MIRIPEKLWFRPDELAGLLETPVRNVYLWLQSDRIRHIHCGKSIKIPRDEVLRIVESGLKSTVATVTN